MSLWHIKLLLYAVLVIYFTALCSHGCMLHVGMTEIWRVVATAAMHTNCWRLRCPHPRHKINVRRHFKRKNC